VNVDWARLRGVVLESDDWGLCAWAADRDAWAALAETPAFRSRAGQRYGGSTLESAADGAWNAAAALELTAEQLASLSALAEKPVESAPRLYVETLNNMIDMQTVRVAGLNNRIPGAVLAVEVGGAAVALALLAFYLSILGRGVGTVLLAAGLITLLLLVTFDLDRPSRGFITIPNAPLVNLRASMELPPAAGGKR